MSLERDGLARSVQVRLARHAKKIDADPNLVLTRCDTKQAQCRAFLGRNRLAGPELDEVVTAIGTFARRPLSLARQRSAER